MKTFIEMLGDRTRDVVLEETAKQEQRRIKRQNEINELIYEILEMLASEAIIHHRPEYIEKVERYKKLLERARKDK